MGEHAREYILAFDTANEVVAIGVGKLRDSEAVASRNVDALKSASVDIVNTHEVAAHRASNTVLLSEVDAALEAAGISKGDIAAIVCGRGPGSFTGVRICMATAKGAASALELPLFGASTLDAVAWNAWADGVRGRVLVAADAMRKEVYPALFDLDESGVRRLTNDTVVKAVAAGEWLEDALASLDCEADAGTMTRQLIILGDALTKYADIFTELGELAPEALWSVSGRGLMLAPRMGDGNPATLLPVYTRLSDAEENERIRLAKTEPKNLHTGVQDEASGAAAALAYRPLDVAHVRDVARLESETMGSDAWAATLVADELPRKDRTWWAAYDGKKLVGYCGGWVVDGQVQILKIATDPTYRRRGIARELIGLVASDARDLGATEMTLEVRLSNEGAQAFYENLGLARIGVRPHYYSDREDAVIMTGPLPVAQHDVAGMTLRVDEVAAGDLAVTMGEGNAFGGDVDGALETLTAPLKDALHTMPSAPESPAFARPLILAIESSCDETAASIIDGNGTILSDVVASQIDFHARFGGVVPEIASRKHIEAICGVCDECLDAASRSLGAPQLHWRDLDAIAVTYAPGLVGALVVGVAFAKGAAWGADKPLIAVNHLEGHLYANRIARSDIKPPMVVSLVSGGHTMLVHVRDWGDYETLGSTIDDAVGEAFDKVAKALGLGYPGGPIISKLAAQGNPKAIDFPRALMHSGDLRFSLSGLKTAVTTYIQKEQQAGREPNMPDIAASFTAAVVDVQVAKAKTALLETGAKEFCLGGGVAANPELRAAYERMCKKIGVRLTMPPLSACGDQAAMIAEVARDRFAQGKFADLSLDVQAHAPLDEPY
ncbi:multifunctional tRNA N6-adenosine(37)-N6- threonylcarbamoyltransferase complex dimerization subunit type 1 TsaB/ribosomal protein alanine acetyltransferase/tRNA (adenosine(37)-N6)-threonylcarbamoyltransferase complex transferase subunit TsaD [Slackia equolifaciens]|uniref:tRNA N6-adenosine threonylcarbamoyltransferase n=1 Tax=Slackia equolifaciens TaxID=498718 RepID=A0A3N0B080_9ACTN|nr:tRNA (adenosine(37)-N6)-threonylcarbamoyltransferase complex transferase subunit TsaD [Slackia equolifaciens]RNL40523.1 multifunctional tRNA N6-adenosine(37)-N6- threonylcarbamoyltransferase complex dimerization subunit type 1 TsaB/ribosomal protein alanine acetyltransferase/tRNA (adenosine(37)-N6)-threonylcarbamoyltransferase complex transferase subunit TsaD [Slackia equolifaciens]